MLQTFAKDGLPSPWKMVAGWNFKAYEGRKGSVSVVRGSRGNARQLEGIPAIWLLAWPRLLGTQVLQVRSTMNSMAPNPSMCRRADQHPGHLCENYDGDETRYWRLVCEAASASPAGHRPAS